MCYSNLYCDWPIQTMRANDLDSWCKLLPNLFTSVGIHLLVQKYYRDMFQVHQHQTQKHLACIL